MSDEAALEIVKDGMFDVPEVAEFMKLSRSEVYAMMEAGRLPFVKHGRRRLVPKRAVQKLLAGELVPAGY